MRDALSEPRTGGGVQAIARAGLVLRALETAPEGIGLADLAVAVELPKSTVHRLLAALAAEDLVELGPEGTARLGSGLVRLGAATRRGLRFRLAPVMLRLRRELDETVDLAILEGDSVTFVEQFPAPHRLRAVSGVGTSFPAHCTANGKALLAALPDEEVEMLLPARLERFTDRTITSRSELLAELAEIRVRGVAFDSEEHTEGISAIGAVVSDPAGPAGAISVPIPTQRFADRRDDYAELVRAGAAEGTRLLGAEAR
ncbi:MAG: IclR family transcriptional regulator [Solirubrobacterales bacterium]